MKITKARLKEIINEELERVMTPEESAADGRAAAAEMKARIAQFQGERGTTDAEQIADIEADLTAAEEKLRKFPDDPRIFSMITLLSDILNDLKS